MKKRKIEVEIVTTSFSHKEKEERKHYPNFSCEYVTINTLHYRRNLSIKRLISHYIFAKDAFTAIEEKNPDLIWVMAPCHSLIKEAKRYKEKHNDVKIIIDIIDMWPESLPFKGYHYIFPLNIWRNVRKNNIECADCLITECDLYKNILQKEYKNKIETLHWSRNSNPINLNKCNDKKLELCYIGSINNIIDIDLICQFIKSLNTEVILHIIGDGEKKDSFIKKANEVCDVQYHGTIFDNKAKKEILENCHAGLNIYNDNLYIGLTVKSIDYMQFGLPVINNIKGDTYNLIRDYKVGFNLDDSFDYKDIIDMRNNNEHIYKTFEQFFGKKAFINKCNEILDEVAK